MMKKQAGILTFAVLSGLINLAALFLTQNPAFSIRSGIFGLLSFAVPTPRVLNARSRVNFGIGVLALLVFAFCVDYFPQHTTHLVSSLGFALFMSTLALMVVKAKPEHYYEAH